MQCVACTKETNMLQYSYSETGVVHYNMGGFCTDCFVEPSYPYPQEHKKQIKYTVVHTMDNLCRSRIYDSEEDAERGAVAWILDYAYEIDGTSFKDHIVNAVRQGRMMDAIRYYNLYRPTKINIVILKAEPAEDGYHVREKLNTFLKTSSEGSNGTV